MAEPEKTHVLEDKARNLKKIKVEHISDAPETETPRKVGYVFSPSYVKLANQLPSNLNRAGMVHSLVAAYKLMPHMKIIAPKPATVADLKKFHSPDYIDFLLSVNENYLEEEDSETAKEIEEKLVEYSLEDDCALFSDMAEYVQYVAGGSIEAGKSLANGECDIAIHWDGGRHHAKKDEASGYCYVNDIVLGILELRKKFDKVLYVDLDLHHGDGVENAFYFTDKIMTLSLHRYDRGFFPGTGAIDNVGNGKGLHHTLNVPLKEGLSGKTLIQVFDVVIEKVLSTYQPDAIVVQCGSDGLVGDPTGEWNLTIDSIGACVERLLSYNKPTLILGGGGYNSPNVARCDTFITAVALGMSKSIHNEIPENPYFTKYGPDFELILEPGNRADLNDNSYVQSLLDQILGRYT
ncbi:hypothetical protein K493DRAFT_285250 [Basidiobolus meristosporus CBS 931.73]|uniref:Histone deacetylase n=1 Tax=Basidiobolus meristosporus CBS 931.73 TaxID=1314790 RepID=A0A1Y1Y4P9_9FUNG|nr:hypothetical protein K493DRAFT_285250 [Basidiobolus meristosporus CBS 931.73]|eukprot:ORX92953.1 hypothetical protein K493DRAFT_285250 [Basidiobolus meristosporus CBS 931.73]